MEKKIWRLLQSPDSAQARYRVAILPRPLEFGHACGLDHHRQPALRTRLDRRKAQADHQTMEARIEKLEEFAVDMRRELHSIDLRLTRIEVVMPTLATKADLELLRVATKSDFDLLRADTKLDIKSLKIDIESVRSDVYKAITDNQKWMIGTVIALFLCFGGTMISISNTIKSFAPARPAALTPQSAPPAPPTAPVALAGPPLAAPARAR